jgi:hypothetical protein
MANDMEETSVDVREQFDAALFGKSMDAFDNFLQDIPPAPASPGKRIVNQATVVLGDDSFLSDDSDNEFACDRRKFERPQHFGALEQMLCKSAAPKLTAKFGDLAVTKDSPGSPGKGNERLFPSNGADLVSKSERGRKRDDLSKSEHKRLFPSNGADSVSKSERGRKRDDLSKSEHRRVFPSNGADSVPKSERGRKRDDLSKSEHKRLFPSNGADSVPKSERGRKRDDLSKSEHISNRKQDDLSKSEHGNRNKRDAFSRSSSRKSIFLAMNEHISRGRSSHEENPVSRQRRLLAPIPDTSTTLSAEASLKTSLSPGPLKARRSITSTATRRRRDELSQSEHCKPRLRRDALNSRNPGKNDLDRSRRSSASPGIRIVNQATDVLGDDNFFNDDSDDEFACDRRKFERPQHFGTAEPMMFKSAAPKLTAKFGDLAVTKDSRGSPGKGNERFFPSNGADSVSKSEHGRKRDDLSKSEHISSRKRDDLSKSEHGNRKRDELSRSSSRKSIFLAMSEHTSRRRSSHEEKPLSRQRSLRSLFPPTSTTHSAEASLRKSLSPGPLKSRRSSTSTATRRRGDELSQSEHWKPRRDEISESEPRMPRLRRDALNSRNVGKNDLDTSRRSRSSTRRQRSDRSHSGDGKPRIRSIEQKPRRLGSSVKAPDKEQISPTGRRSGSAGRREHRGSGMPTDAHLSPRRSSGSKRVSLIEESKSSVQSLPRRSSGSKRVPLTEDSKSSVHSLPRRSSGSKRAPVTEESKASVHSLPRRSSGSKRAPVTEELKFSDLLSPRRSSGSKRAPLTEESKPMHRSRSHTSCGELVPKGSRNNLKTIGEESRPICRSISTADARIMRTPKKDVDQLLFKTIRESKTKMLSKMGNATWDLTATRD